MLSYSTISFAFAIKFPQAIVGLPGLPIDSTNKYLTPFIGPGNPAFGPATKGFTTLSTGLRVFCGKVAASIL